MPRATDLVRGVSRRTPYLPATDAGCEEVATGFRALSEPTRLRILRRLARGEASVGEVVADVGGTQANVSKHLTILLSSDIVDRKRRGGRIPDGGARVPRPTA